MGKSTKYAIDYSSKRQPSGTSVSEAQGMERLARDFGVSKSDLSAAPKSGQYPKADKPKK